MIGLAAVGFLCCLLQSIFGGKSGVGALQGHAHGTAHPSPLPLSGCAFAAL